MQYFKMTVCPYTQPEVFILHLRSMNMHSSSSQASTVARFKYHQITVISFREYSEKQIPCISSNYKMFYMKSGAVFP
jgi:hypothetical protein